MINLSGKYVTTENNVESGRLLKMAVSQGYKLQIGEKVMENSRLFHFHGFPYKTVTIPERISLSEYDKAVRYGDLCGDEVEELQKLVDSAMRWCRAHGYSHVGIYANEESDKFTGQAMANAEDGMRQHVESSIQKPHKVTLEEIEKQFGYPIEVVS